MKTIILAIKIAILFALFSMALCCLFDCWEQNASMSDFFTHVLSHKAYALLFGYGAYRLYQIWKTSLKTKE